MLRTIFGKTVFEKRWTILWWCVAALGSVAMVSLLFPAIRDTMGEMMGAVPAGMENWFGSAEIWQTFAGFAGQEIFGQMAILMIIMAIMFGANFLAGEEGSGTLLTVLAKPVRRGRVFWQKYLGFVAVLVLAAVAFYVGAVLGGWILGEAVPYLEFLQSTLMVFLLSLTLGTLAFSLGAITGRSGVAGLIVGFYAFVAYFLSSLSTITEIVDKISYASLFRYVDAPGVLASDLNAGNIWIFVAVIAVSLAAALPIFGRRDLRTR
jgi:ABC-2 type transport system permease protein